MPGTRRPGSFPASSATPRPRPGQAGPAQVPVSLGRSGLGWGLGLHAGKPAGPVKREGDGRAPAGVFAVGPAFGEAAAPAPTRLDYFQATPGLVCVDDAASRHYNRIVSPLGPAEWDSAETMLRPDGLYALGAVLGHNASPPRPGAGSCIFLHVRRGPDVPTAGCTALDRPDLAELLAWLDAEKNPVLVQLPRPEFKRLRQAWGLP